jgi:tRNA(Ile)-lysidine synthase
MKFMEFDTMGRTVLDFIRKNGLLRGGEKVLVAVSGGPDSVFLLHFLNQYKEELKCTLVTCHINHTLRGEASLLDREFVRRMSEDFRIPFETFDVDVRGFKEKRRLSIEESARVLRYSTLERCAREKGAEKIALGHTRDDSIETFLLNLFRGSGRKGLTGIQPKRGKLIRPLLCLSKREILTSLKRLNIDYRIDASNWRTEYARNFIRRDLVPLIEEKMDRNIKGSVSQLIKVFGEEEELLERTTEECFRNICEKKESGIEIERSRFNSLHTALQRRIVRRCFSEISGDVGMMNYKEVESLRRVINGESSGVRILYPPVLFLISSEKILIGEERDELQSGDGINLTIPGSATFLDRSILSTSIVDTVSETFDNSNCVYFDIQKIEEPLTVRTRVNGDTFTPFGFPHEKKVKELLIDEKIPFWERDTIPLVSDKKGILWVVGVRRSDRAKISEETKGILKIESEIVE